MIGSLIKPFEFAFCRVSDCPYISPSQPIPDTNLRYTRPISGRMPPVLGRDIINSRSRPPHFPLGSAENQGSRARARVRASQRQPQAAPSLTAREPLFGTSPFPSGKTLGRATALLALDGPSPKGVPERFAFGAAGLCPPLRNRAQGCALSPGQARTISLRLPPKHSPAPAGSPTTPIP